MKRRTVLAGIVLGAAGLPLARAADAAPVLQVWRTPTCGCCGAWVRHMETNGFRVEVTMQDDLSAIKAKHGVPRSLESCHTGVVGGYVVEGHVPAGDVKRLLRERPPVAGLVVPGMPAGSPGMEGPVSEPYATLALAADGTTTVFARH
ncbi:MAG: DUF411 domain-containing protein [Chromatiales bacterium]|nr:DUF411 domain-containing protein [Chromatiales bacterium]